MYKQTHGGWLITINTPDYWEVDLMTNLIEFGTIFYTWTSILGV